MAETARYFQRTHSGEINRLDEIIAMQRGVILNHIHLVASACIPFPSVLAAMSEPVTLLPTEGLPGARYLPGAEVMDIVENESEKLILSLFSNPVGYRATIQPHSGTQANQIAYNAALKPDDRVLCLKPRDGGHISHTVLISRRHETYNYGLTPSGEIDFEQLEDLARSVRPRLIIAGGSSLPRAIDFKRLGEIAAEHNALLHADLSHTATFVAAGLHPSPFPYCDFVTFTMSKNLRGPNGGVLIYRSSFFDQVSASIFPTTQGGANETTMLGKFAALVEWSNADIRSYAVNIVIKAKRLGERLQSHGVQITTGGTDCHILLVELRDWPLSGADMEMRLEEAGILANKNLIPNDRRPPSQTSGIRFGSTNLAILDYSNEDLDVLADVVVDIFEGRGEEGRVAELVRKYPAIAN